MKEIIKKIEKRIYYFAFFCILAIALFSLENTMQIEQNDLLIERIREPMTRRSATDDATQNPPARENSAQTAQEVKPEPTQKVIDTPPSTPHIEEKKEEVSDVVTPPDIEKTTPTENSKEKTKEKKDDFATSEQTEFSSIQSSGLTLANGNTWYFEEYDENGNIVSIASYNKKKLLSKSQFEYNTEGKKISATLTEPKKIIKLTFNDKGEEIGRTEYKKRKGQIGEVYSSYQKGYDSEGRLQEEKITENGIIKRKVYTYNGKKKITETTFENDMKTLFVEYKENIKVVHIFDEGNEISVFEEALE